MTEDDYEARCQTAAQAIRDFWALYQQAEQYVLAGIDDAETEANWPMGDK